MKVRHPLTALVAAVVAGSVTAIGLDLTADWVALWAVEHPGDLARPAPGTSATATVLLLAWLVGVTATLVATVTSIVAVLGLTGGPHTQRTCAASVAALILLTMTAAPLAIAAEEARWVRAVTSHAPPAVLVAAVVAALVLAIRVRVLARLT